MRSAALIPAAGASVRMGRPKLLLELGGRTLIENAIRTAVLAGCSPVVVVVGGGPPAIARIAEQSGAEVVVNGDWANGLGSSISRGMAALSPAVDVVVILPADQIDVEPEHLRRLIASVREEGGVAATDFGGSLGAPAAFAAGAFGLLRELDGDRGARDSIQNARSLAPPRPIRDLDTLRDFSEAGGKLEGPE
ncbi:MAG: NTP transferase domain-containing protein [Thermoanaerobaculia bacterium]